MQGFPEMENGDDIYRIKRNVLERLRHNKALLELLDRQSQQSREMQPAKRKVEHEGKANTPVHF
jgi:hypothetical protein